MSTRYGMKVSLLLALMMFAFASLGLVAAAFAQDPTPEPTEIDLTIITGAVEVRADGVITVGGVILDVNPLLLPPVLANGDIVLVTGVFIDEITLVVVSFELFAEEVTPTPTVDPLATLTPTVDPLATVTPTVDPLLTPTVDPLLTPTAVALCGNQNHPVAQRIAETFEVTYEEVMALHCDGNGFGNIVRAYALAEAAEDGTTAQDYIDRHQNGEGWGQILRDSDVHPSELAPGRVLRGGEDDEDDESAENAEAGGGNGNGNGNGNSNGNGGRGNGGSRGNGGGNGNGNGNGGGNGNGRGGRGG